MLNTVLNLVLASDAVTYCINSAFRLVRCKRLSSRTKAETRTLERKLSAHFRMSVWAMGGGGGVAGSSKHRFKRPVDIMLSVQCASRPKAFTPLGHPAMHVPAAAKCTGISPCLAPRDSPPCIFRPLQNEQGSFPAFRSVTGKAAVLREARYACFSWQNA